MKFRVRPLRVAMVGVAVICIGLTSACGGDSPDAGNRGDTGDAGNAKVRELFPEAVLDRGVLRVGLVAPTPPNAMVSGGAVSGGVDHDLLSAVAELAGLKAEFTALPFDAVVPSLQAGRSDVSGSLVPTPERTKIADFVLHAKVPFGVLLPKDNPLGVEGAADLCGHSVALVRGSIPPQALVKDRTAKCEANGEPPIKTTEYAAEDGAVLAVKSGDADAFIQGAQVTEYIAAKTDQGNTFTSVPDLDGLGGQVFFAEGFGVLKSNTKLIEAIQAAMQELVANGTYKTIQEKYGLGELNLKDVTINEFSEDDSAN